MPRSSSGVLSQSLLLLSDLRRFGSDIDVALVVVPVTVPEPVVVGPSSLPVVASARWFELLVLLVVAVVVVVSLLVRLSKLGHLVSTRLRFFEFWNWLKMFETFGTPCVSTCFSTLGFTILIPASSVP